MRITLAEFSFACIEVKEKTETLHDWLSSNTTSSVGIQLEILQEYRMDAANDPDGSWNRAHADLCNEIAGGC